MRTRKKGARHCEWGIRRAQRRAAHQEKRKRQGKTTKIECGLNDIISKETADASKILPIE